MSFLTLSPEMLVQWEKERDRLEKEINEAQRKLLAINQLLRAGAVLAGPNRHVGHLKAEESEPSESFDPSNLMGTLARIANESQKPLTKSELKAELKAIGVPEERLGSYFYVAIDRLKKKGRISVRDDGSVWKGETYKE